MKNARTTVYGRTAYEGFAKAIGSKLGLTVTVDDGASACINSNGTIMLPGMNTYQTVDEFEVTCGTLVHEIAHQFYGSHHHIDANRAPLEHDCLNAVLDVADETWISEWFNRDGNGRPADLLLRSNYNALNQNRGAYGDWKNAATHAWKVLVIGILSARLPRGMSRWRRFTASQCQAHGVDALACFRLIRRAKRTKREAPRPCYRRFRKLHKLARELADLLRPFAPQQPTMQSPLGKALQNGQSKKPAGVTEATAAQAEAMADGPVTGQGTGGTNASRRGGATEAYDADSFTMLFPAAERVASRIATDGDGLNRDDGLASGPCIGQAHRLMTDGLCLSRWSTSENADGVAVSVVLDCSSSMRHRLATCAGIARAFAQAMRNAGPVQSIVFGSTSQQSDDFRRVTDMGSTRTDLALHQAATWLRTKTGQRWIVLVTDGEPDSSFHVDIAMDEAAARGIKVLAVGLGCDIRMPGARCVTASDPTHLAIELDAAARRIECGA